MPVAMAPQGQHYVYVSVPTPQTVQNVPMGYTQTMRTPMKMKLGNSPSVTLPVAMTPQTPQSTPKTPKTPKSDSKENSDSDENDGEKSKSKKKCESVKESKENKEHDSSRNKNIVIDKEQETPSEPKEQIYLKLSREHLNLPKVQRLLGYRESKVDKIKADNVQDQTQQAAVTVSQQQPQQAAVTVPQ